MERIINSKIQFFNELTRGNLKWIGEQLSQEGISILPGFMNNHQMVKEFYQKYYSFEGQRIVLCGINPGRLGAGKTGVPFLDFLSISKLMSNINENDQEKSAQFIFELLLNLGIEEFFKKVYLTNFSWFGFVKLSNNLEKNINYYQLSMPIQKIIAQNFIEELNYIKPKCILPLSEEVEKTLKDLKKQGLLKYELMPRLPHPYYCSFNNREKHLKEYEQSIILSS